MDIQRDVIDSSFKNKNLYNVVFEITTNCNWKCKHCYISEHQESYLTKEKIFDIFKQLREIGVFELTLTGGEIFTRPDIMEIVKKAREMYFKLILFTNVSLLNEEKIHQLAEYHIAEISCTIFSLKPRVHDYITGVNGSLEKAMNNIQLIKKYKIPLTLKTILTNVNYDEAEKIQSFCTDNNFSYNIDHDIFSQKNGNSSPCDLRMTKEQLHVELKNFDRIRNYNPRKHLNNELVCGGIQNALFIDNNAVVHPCNKFLYPIGNLNEQSIKDIWRTSKTLHNLQGMKWADLKKCKSCDKEEFCIHCPGTALLEDGDAYGQSTLACEKAEIRKELYAY